jgi:hypothetical protein
VARAVDFRWFDVVSVRINLSDPRRNRKMMLGLETARCANPGLSNPREFGVHSRSLKSLNHQFIADESSFDFGLSRFKDSLSEAPERTEAETGRALLHVMVGMGDNSEGGKAGRGTAKRKDLFRF